MCGRCSHVCCLLQVYLAIDARIASGMRVETDLEDVLDCGGQEHLHLFYGNNESMQTGGTTSDLNFHYGEAEGCHLARLKLQSFF